MALIELYKRNFAPQVVPIQLGRSKMVRTEKELNGVLVDDYSFEDTDPKNDPRNLVHYQDLCLSNLKKLGVTDKLQNCMLQRDDVDLVSNEIEKFYVNEPAQAPTENS